MVWCEMIKLKQILLETPHEITIDGKTIVDLWTDIATSYSFGIYNGNLLISSANKTHWEMRKEYTPRFGYKYPGRIWTTKKLISFWEYPTDRKIFNRIINGLKRKLNIVPEKFQIELLHKDNYVLLSYDSISSMEVRNPRYWSSLISVKDYMERYTK